MQPGLLGDLAHRRDGGVLAAVELALGEGPVVVLGPVHEQHPPAWAEDDDAGGAHVLRSGGGHGDYSRTTSPGTSRRVSTRRLVARTRWTVVVAAALGLVLVAALVVVAGAACSAATTDERARAATGRRRPRAGRCAGAGRRPALLVDRLGRRTRRARASTSTPRRPPAQVEDLLDRGFDADLTSASALLSSAVTMQQRFGFSPATLEWELFSQSDRRGVADDAAGRRGRTDDVRDALRAPAVRRARRPRRGLDAEPGPPISGQVTPELRTSRSTTSAGAGGRLRHPGGRRRGGRRGRGDAGPGPIPAAVVDGGRRRPSSAIALHRRPRRAARWRWRTPTRPSRTPAEALVARGRQGQPDDRVRDRRPSPTARCGSRWRSRTPTRRAPTPTPGPRWSPGPAPGQGGDFTDRFTSARSAPTATSCRWSWSRSRAPTCVSDLSSGPVLFATC